MITALTEIPFRNGTVDANEKLGVRSTFERSVGMAILSTGTSFITLMAAMLVGAVDVSATSVASDDVT